MVSYTMQKAHSLAVVLCNPDMPANTGNIIRLCANTGCELHLVKPMGFALNDSKLKRAGLDYHEYAHVIIHNDFIACKQYFGDRRIIAIETDGDTYFHEHKFKSDDVLLFGSETKGLSKEIMQSDQVDIVTKIPMQDCSRSINLSNSVAITVYEAWRQLNFIGGI